MAVREDEMNKRSKSWTAAAWLVAAATLGVAADATAKIEGVTGTSFTLVAKAGHISTADGGSIYNWGYALRVGSNPAAFQYPGPTLIVNQGDRVEVTLFNELPTNVSLLFPGQIDVDSEAAGCPGGMANGRITREARPGGCLKYSFIANKPGTYTYHSGTQMPVQLEMGLFGALIVRPNGAPNQAYEHPGTRFDREHLVMLSEIDPVWHEAVARQAAAASGANWTVNTSGFEARNPLYWFVNGRNAPDTLVGAYAPQFPAQPYNALPRMHPGERLLLRTINAGIDLHPFHTHGNNTWTIAVDGRVASSAPGAGPDVARSDNTLRMVPGQTVDAIYEWTGKGLNWDAYGIGDSHTCNGVTLAEAAANPADPRLQLNGGFDPASREYCPDHGKPLPTVLPSNLEMTFGDFFSGSPFLGATGGVPVGAGRLGAGGAYFHMFHSHNEREIINNGVFPGGMMTFVVIEPANVPID
jgi:FtsP/CotA-like multicopper oxidase with cupredoxin domain